MAAERNGGEGVSDACKGGAGGAGAAGGAFTLLTQTTSNFNVKNEFALNFGTLNVSGGDGITTGGNAGAVSLNSLWGSENHAAITANG